MMMSRIFLPILAVSLMLGALSCGAAQTFVVESNAVPRVLYGVEKLRDAAGVVTNSAKFIVGTVGRSAALDGLSLGKLPGKEGFILTDCGSNVFAVAGVDDNGTLYGCLELARRISQSNALPTGLHFSDAPAFTLRGPCIGMQKTFILPGRHVYEYPYTPELFPFFYDKQFWTEYLDFLATNRMNTLYLWNGHPFSSLVKVKEYPYAVEVPDDVFQKNVEMFRFITQEADRRGIWLVQMFYSLILSKPFAETNGLQTQLAAPVPVAADYTRKSIAEFVKQYPHAGLMVCLGEALQGIDNQRDWLNKVILPGIQDGRREAGLTEQPPVVIRTHATDLRQIMPDALKIYTNLYTEAKFNGESLTTWEPRGKRQQVHLDMSRLGSTHMINVHILANLEPFRYGAQRFIQKCVQAGRDRLGARGVHLYPLFYWNWPDSPDKTDVPLKQWERDWIWFEAWSRYAWNPDIPEAQDREYWLGRLSEMYGTSEAAAGILDAYNDSGECAPRLLRRFGITEGNRQTLSLGMTLDELVNPAPYKPFEELWESQSPPGERLDEYAKKEWAHQPHEGETPPQIVRETLDFSQKAVQAIQKAAPHVTRNREEFARLSNDVVCIRAMTESYDQKIEAAMLTLRYQYSHDIADMEHAEQHLEKSFAAYQRLAALTEPTYRFANSMQTSQRKIPVSGGSHGQPANYHWTQLVGLYGKELTNFQAKVVALKSGSTNKADEFKPWTPAPFKLISTNAETYEVMPGAVVFTDRTFAIRDLAPELRGLTGIRFPHEAAKKGQMQPLEIELAQPSRVLVGYVKSRESGWLQVPNLETAAQADERGGIEPVLLNAAAFEGMPGVNVHAFNYDAGRQKIELIGKGSYVILGVIPQSVKTPQRDAGR